MDYAQKVAAFTRRRVDGEVQLQPAQFILAAFQHGTSRALDMHLHTHVVLLNCAARESGFGSLETIFLFREKLMIGSIYQTRLAQELRNSLGLSLEPDRFAFRIVGVPESSCEHFSKRSNEMKSVMEKRGLKGAVAAREIALETRPEKVGIDEAKLFAVWQQQSQSLGWGPQQALELLRRGQVEVERRQKRPEPGIGVKEAHQRLEQAMLAVPENRRTRGRAMNQACKLSIEHGLDPSTLAQVVNEYDDRKKSGLRVEWQRLFDKTPWVPARRQFVHVSWVSPFWKSSLKKIRDFKLPVLTVNVPKIVNGGPPQPFQGEWGKIEKKWNLFFGELRIQDRALPRKKARRTGVPRSYEPELRFTFKKSKWQPPPKKKNQEQQQDITHSY